MASCPAPSPGCRGCIHELVNGVLYANQFGFPKRIMPKPEWCQEAAMVGLFIDELRETEEVSPE